ncbi:hypothetical protein IRL76_07305 [Qipengyuania soli]|uniref:Uncharacterized protein n=1 Tax=Qipengyuania soli TaxID=2782568 RepID=A0A7S8IW96_9SPHN|nr:hypothetical protein IRL76_07305 [Qipengyuania soli]
MGLGAAAMSIAPVAAQAGTRASDAGAVAVQPVKMSTVTRSAQTAEKKNELGGPGLIIAILAVAAIIAGIVIAADDDKSPGA